MTEILHTFRSAVLQNDRSLWIRPPLRRPAHALTLFLDGEFYRERVGAVAILDALFSQREIADSWVVFVSMASIEARWKECPCYPPVAHFVGRELMPWLSAHFPELQNVTQRNIVGLSYTGLAAAYVAKENPVLFQKILCQSGSFWWKENHLAEQYLSWNPAVPMEFYLDVGTGETAENVRHREDVLQVVSQIAGVRHFRDTLLRRGHSVLYREFDGGHDFAAWKTMLPDALRWALGNTRSAQPLPVESKARANDDLVSRSEDNGC